MMEGDDLNEEYDALVREFELAEQVKHAKEVELNRVTPSHAHILVLRPFLRIPP